MGVYSNGDIYGVRWCESGIFHSRTYPVKMGLAQCLEVKAAYDKLVLPVTQLEFYTLASTTYQYPTSPFMLWFPGVWATFEKYMLLQQNGAQNS